MKALKQCYCAAIFVLAFVACAQGWQWRLAPQTLRFKVHFDCAPFWDGVVDINEAAIDPTGSVSIRNLTLNDRAGRNWLSVPSARCAYGYDQNNLTLKEVRIERPQVTLWYDNNSLNVPLHYTSSQSTQASSSSLTNIQRLVVNEATLTLAGEDFKVIWDGLSLTATQADERSKYAVSLTRKLPNSAIDAHGIVNMGTEDVNVDVTARHTMDRNETAMFFKYVAMPIIHDVNGQLKVNLRFAGNLRDPAMVWPVGYVVIKNGALNGSGGCLLEKLNSRITFVGNKLMAFDTIEGAMLDGRFHGTGFLTVRRDNTVWFGGHIAAQNIDLARYSDATGHVGYLSKGKVSLRYDFTATNRKVDDHKGRGVIFLDDADLWKMPVVSTLFKFIDMPLIYSDGVARFKTVGPAVIFDEARISSPMTAIEFQKNSYINMQTEYVDAYAVFVPIKKIRAIEEMIPFFKIFMNWRDTLARVTIRGRWSEPSSRLIRKDMLQDIGASTINFFTDVADSGGQIGTDIVGRLQPLWATPATSDTALEVGGAP